MIYFFQIPNHTIQPYLFNRHGRIFCHVVVPVISPLTSQEHSSKGMFSSHCSGHSNKPGVPSTAHICDRHNDLGECDMVDRHGNVIKKEEYERNKAKTDQGERVLSTAHMCDCHNDLDGCFSEYGKVRKGRM